MDNKIPRDCAEAFAQLRVDLTPIPDMARTLDGIHKALYGNGTPSRGLLTRVDRLEEAKADVQSHWKTIRKRMIDISVAILLLYIGMRLGK